MILHAEGRQLAMPHAFDRAVVQIAVRHFEATRQILLGHGEAVILRRDLDSPGFQILHRLVGAAMAELQLEGRCAAGQRLSS